MTPTRLEGASVPSGVSSLRTSPTRQFALLSLLVIGGSTLVLGLVLSYFVEQGILDREWGSTAALVRTAVRFYLRSEDFAPGVSGAPLTTAATADRFEEFTRQISMLPEIGHVVAYDGRGQVLWTDAERRGPLAPSGDDLHGALEGATRVRLVPADENGVQRVELYVPIRFPGEGRIAGVVRTNADATRVLAIVQRARFTLWTLAALSGAALYVALYGIVWRASRALRRQHATLAQRAEELARANRTLREVQEQLVTAERFAAFGEITAAVAHGIENPLAAIRATAQLAMLDAQDSVRERLAQIVAGVDRLTERMRSLLRLGSPIEQRRVPTAIEAAVAQTVTSVREGCAARGVRLELDIPADLPKVRLDPARFEEALLCLLGNALDAMPTGGILRVSVGPANARRPVEVVVEDTGPGMPPDVLTRAFEPFFTTKSSGTGLGLAVARKLLDNAGASLHLESTEGRGTRAVVRLPEDET